MGVKATPASERFHGRYAINPDSGCWEWTGHVSNVGYGTTSERGKALYAHRVSYEMHKGSIPEGLVIDHLCENRRCVNPDHLAAVTHRANILRSPSPRMERLRQGVCVRGHDLTDPANVYIRRDNGRPMCVPCKRIRDLERARANGVAERTPPRCGTHSGAINHYRKGEPCCEPCKAAKAAYMRELNARRRGSWPEGDPPKEVVEARNNKGKDLKRRAS